MAGCGVNITTARPLPGLLAEPDLALPFAVPAAVNSSEEGGFTDLVTTYIVHIPTTYGWISSGFN